jgi:hypothetical protein
MECEIIEETSDNLICEDVLRWRYAIQKKCWTKFADGIYRINEKARREEIAKRAYFRWKLSGRPAEENWLAAENEVDMALLE